MEDEFETQSLKPKDNNEMYNKMKLAKFNPTLNKPMNHWVDRFFNDGHFSTYFDRSFTQMTPSVNVVELTNGFRIEIAAPGLTKSDFKINLDKDLLAISVARENNNEESGEKFYRREFNYSSFERKFRLPETVDTDGIKASYDNGVLNVSLPKRDEAIEKPARDIEIS